MFGITVLQLFLSSFLLNSIQAQPFKCDFGGGKLKANSHNITELSLPFTVVGQLPPSRTQTHSCVVTSEGNSFLRVKAKKSGQSGGTLHVSVYRADDSSILGHMDVSESTNWTSLTVCPSLHKTLSHSLVTFSGTTNFEYTAEIDQGTIPVELNKAVNVKLCNTEVSIFQFKPPQGISKKQLDITVESDSNVPAYMKVSHSCKDVLQNMKNLDYNGASLRLSFGEKGRITLSKSSMPPLDNSEQPWFIGIALKNSTGKLQIGTSKWVNLKLMQSFNYDYTNPMYFLIFTSFFGGILVSLWALFCFREPYDLVRDESTMISSSSQGVPTIKQNIINLFYSCWKCGAADDDEMQPLLRGRRSTELLSWKELFQALKKVGLDHWFERTPKAFSYTTCIVGFVLLIGAFQFVFENWQLMIESGDRDKCYYNDFCYRVSGIDIPFNLMISNLAYIIHGLVLSLSVWVMEAELLAWCKRVAVKSRCNPPLPDDHERLPEHVIVCPDLSPHLARMSVPSLEMSLQKSTELHTEALKRKFSFSIGYAFAWALIFEGLFSTLYHFCPSKLTFQFDTAFMFVTAGLIVLSLYNGIILKACPVNGKEENPVKAANYFLYFIVPLYIFNYFGSLYYAKQSFMLVLKILFFLSLAVWYLSMFLWAGFKLFYKTPHAADLRNCNTITKSVIFTIVMVTACIALPVIYKTDFPDIFLFTCISTSLLAILGKVFVQFWNSERSHWTLKKVAFRLFQASYVVVTLAIMGTAVWFFSAKATTNKVESPEQSRDLNKDCVLLNFFDYHDIWHVMSSFSLLMGAYLVLYISG